MKIKFFADTDNFYIAFSQKTPMETRDLDENSQLCSMAIKYAKERVSISKVDYQ